jgi:hypothetical protein
MREHAKIRCSCWQDVQFLDLSSHQKLTYFVVLSQQDVSFCGVLYLQKARWARLIGDRNAAQTGRSLAELARRNFILIDEGTHELWVRTFVKHDGILASPNLIVAMTRDFGLIASPRIREGFLEGLGEGFLEGLPKGLPQRFPEPFLKGFRERFPLARAGARTSSFNSPASPPADKRSTFPGGDDPTATTANGIIAADAVRGLTQGLRGRP